MICKNCSKVIDEDSRFCKYCGYRVEYNKPWNIRICKDERFCNESFFEDFPSIIAHEYYRIYKLMLENKTYGAMMQIKDLLEILIKIPVVIEMARLRAKENKTEFDYLFISNLLRKAVALGDWRKAIVDMSTHREHGFDYNFIQDLKSMYTRNKPIGHKSVDLVNWRNETIGHGALAFDHDENFKNEIEGLLSLITDHFNKWEKIYKSMKFYVEDPEYTVFRGKDAALNLKYDNSKLFFQNDEGVKLSLYPFLLLWDKQFYIFDALIYDKEKYDVLCYPIGRKQHFKQTELQKYIKDIFEQSLEALKRNKYLVQSTGGDSSAEDSTFLLSYDDYLNIEDEKICDMKMLDDWLLKGLTQSENKIFLLMMERGMGKTTWVKNISKGKGFGQNIVFKPIYLNDTYRSRQESIVSKIDQVMVTDHNHAAVFDDGKNKHIRMDVEDLKLEIANFCTYYTELYKKEQKADKIVLILDGIDEVMLNYSNNILDCIPTSTMLPEDFYILLTCRDSQDISDFLNVWVNELKIPEQNKFTVYRDDKEYCHVLENHINSYTSGKDAEKILHMSEYRFAYLTILLKTLERTEEEKRSSLLENGNIIKAFLDMIEKNYEEKYLSTLHDILYTIAIAPEPITVKELSYLLGETKISFTLLGFLNDLKGILKYERTDQKNKISIANRLYKDSLFKVLSQKDGNIDERFNSNIVDLVSDMYIEFVAKGKDIVGEGQAFLLLHLNYYNSEEMAEYIDYGLFVSIFNCAERYIKSFPYEDTKRGYEMLENADMLNFDVSPYSKNDPLIERILKRHIHLVLQYKLLFRWQDLYINDNISSRLSDMAAECEEQYQDLKKLPQLDDPFLNPIIKETKNIYTYVLMEYGKYYFVQGKYEDAKILFLIAKHKMEQEKLYDPLRYQNLLRSLYQIHSALGEKKEASQYFEQYGNLEHELQAQHKHSYDDISHLELEQELAAITDVESSKKQVYMVMDELENRLAKLDGSSNEYYTICERESALLSTAVKSIGQEYLKNNQYTDLLGFSEKMGKMKNELIKRNFVILSETNIYLAYYRGFSNMMLGSYDEAAAELNIMQMELNEIEDSSRIMKESRGNILYLKYISNILLCRCSVFSNQDYENAFQYLLQAEEVYDERSKISQISEETYEDFLKQILKLYDSIYTNARETHKEKLEDLKKLFEKYHKDFAMYARKFSWEKEYIIIDKNKDEFISCPNGSHPKRFELLGKYYELDFKRICNRCTYKDCIGYRSAGAFKIKK